MFRSWSDLSHACLQRQRDRESLTTSCCTGCVSEASMHMQRQVHAAVACAFGRSMLAVRRGHQDAPDMLRVPPDAVTTLFRGHQGKLRRQEVGVAVAFQRFAYNKEMFHIRVCDAELQTRHCLAACSQVQTVRKRACTCLQCAIAKTGKTGGRTGA